MIHRTTLSVRERAGELHEAKRSGVLLEILVVFAPLLILGGIGEWLGDGTAAGIILLNLAYVLSIGIATVVLKSRGTGWRQIGLARPGSWPKTLLFAAGTLLGYLLVSVALQAILASLPGVEIAAADRSSFDPLYGNLPLLLLYVAAAWTTIAFGEEMVYRAFLTNGLARLFQGSRARWMFALIGSSFIFGLAHFSWGLAGIVETTLMGFVFGFAYLRSGQNLWVPIIAHGLANTLGFTLVFMGVQ
jgi:membrane protease YdiL (CAAX protease family)